MNAILLEIVLLILSRVFFVQLPVGEGVLSVVEEEALLAEVVLVAAVEDSSGAIKFGYRQFD